MDWRPKALTNPEKTGAVAFFEERFAAVLGSFCCDLVVFLAMVVMMGG
jgi:hypothetical protein